MALGNAVKTVRMEKGLTREALAARVAVTRQSIIAIEKGKYVPSVRLALEIARALETPLEELFWLADE